MSLIVNLFGGPSSGKSTLAARLFHRLKSDGIRAELVAEYAKEWAWDGRKIQPIDEMVIYGRQLERERRFYSLPIVAITDRPLPLSSIYCEFYGDRARAKIVADVIDSDHQIAFEMGARFLNVMVAREKDYDPVGRFESEESAHQVDQLIRDRLYINYEYTNDRFEDLCSLLSSPRCSL